MRLYQLVWIGVTAIVSCVSAKEVSMQDIALKLDNTVQFGSVKAKVVQFGGYTTPQCKLAISLDGKYFFFKKMQSTCKTLINSKGIKIVCNADKSVCKTRQEIKTFVLNQTKDTRLSDTVLESSSIPAWCNDSGLNRTEHAICANEILSALDIKLTKIYDSAKVDDKDIEQKRWLRKRNMCQGDVSCIDEAYEERIEALNNQKMQNTATEKPNLYDIQTSKAPSQNNDVTSQRENTLLQKGNYLSAEGCINTHGYGMAIRAWKIIQSEGKYYCIDFDISCEEGEKPYFIADQSLLVGHNQYVRFKPINVGSKHKFTIADYGNRILIQKGDSIIISLSEEEKEEAKKYLLMLKDKETLSDVEKRQREKAKGMLNSDGYIVFSKPTNTKYQRLFDQVLSIAMIKTINKRNNIKERNFDDLDNEEAVKSVKILLKSKEKVNECITDILTDPRSSTPYEIVEKDKKMADTLYQSNKKYVDSSAAEYAEKNKKGTDEIYRLFKKYGQTATCKD